MAHNDKSKNWRARTKLVHGGSVRSQYGETSEALYMTSGYVYDNAEQAEARFLGDDDGYQYTRFANPTTRIFENRMIALEGAEDARATATGMSAVTAALLCYLSAGDHLIAARALFGACRYIVEDLLPRFGIETTLVDGCDSQAWADAVRPNTKAFFLESPANPLLEIIDIEAVANIAHAHKALLMVDNVFATPMLQKPLALGADVVIYSATKHIDGQGRCLGGIVLGRQAWIDDYLANFLRQTGPAMSPFNAWLLLKALETLPLRIDAHVEGAELLAAALSAHPKLAKLIYPFHKDHPQFALAKKQMSGGGSLIALQIKGGKAAAFALQNELKIACISNNLGDAKTLITHPATTTHQRLSPQARAQIGVSDSLLRISVGLEDPADLIDDFNQALDKL
ncbi:MAG: O-succinylhomoserine sulfhydrylase [Alphaproteobacteria bacterium]|nr:O-succinylhomoserine sulfhydrylase [Alphaproteobacteria bacterium]